MDSPKFQAHTDDNDAICPYCGHRYQVEAEDYDEDGRQETCDECGKKYWLHQSFSVTHHTQPDCWLNGDEHQYERVDLKNGLSADFCKICDDCRAIPIFTDQEASQT